MVLTCVLCRSSEQDELIFGTVHVDGKMMVHRNCLYLSSNLIQRGDSNLDIMNFRKQDIEAEAERCRSLKCCYCRRLGANIVCCKSGCRRTFHTKCGADNLAQNQFCHTYKSFCHQHVPVLRHRPAYKKDEKCLICLDDLIAKGERFSVVSCLFAPCCRNGWFHRRCLQGYANSSGYFFKCPLCNNIEMFRRVVYMGIAVLNQDPSWETEPGAFAEQFRRDLICTATFCNVVSGHNDIPAMLLYCTSCGANPSHLICTLMDYDTYVCEVCSAVTPEAVPVPEVDADSMDENSFLHPVWPIGPAIA
ncbi:PHD finger protein 7 [Drosophila mauritiana]|uniref:PHD finger protein 7 n=1 Tax=Drosophila mauritiana TaxID=7226 RepID=A0A6P8KQP0_DROMA|nr:PHD finger protein 7 [Drosophila mauritiana]XP_033171356.1 PHD finger protein 7 [Drosophila mauritiana]XP_033171357.1 PHD finger protein 7 [Drosophila mauritiana]XP_033171358.1 PHD finger protein 7 [Drosophila mauritiana]XP_033171359.1 PHD finger protein 7 [Drosophila mauritiana]